MAGADDRPGRRADRRGDLGPALLGGPRPDRSVRTTGNQRRYERATIRRVSFIRAAQRVGLTLDEIGDRAGDAARRAHADRPRLGQAVSARGAAGSTSRSGGSRRSATGSTGASAAAASA